MRNGQFILFSALVVTVLLGYTASANAEDLRKKYALPTHVQLKPFTAPTSRPGRMTPVTVYLEAVNKEQSLTAVTAHEV